MSKPEDQLAAVAMQFKQWRLSKKHSNSAAPEHLRQQVVVLAKHFKVSLWPDSVTSALAEVTLVNN